MAFNAFNAITEFAAFVLNYFAISGGLYEPFMSEYTNIKTESVVWLFMVVVTGHAAV